MVLIVQIIRDTHFIFIFYFGFKTLSNIFMARFFKFMTFLYTTGLFLIIYEKLIK